MFYQTEDNNIAEDPAVAAPCFSLLSTTNFFVFFICVTETKTCGLLSKTLFVNGEPLFN